MLDPHKEQGVARIRYGGKQRWSRQKVRFEVEIDSKLFASFIESRSRFGWAEDRNERLMELLKSVFKETIKNSEKELTVFTLDTAIEFLERINPDIFFPSNFDE